MEKQEDTMESSTENNLLEHYIALADSLLTDLISDQNIECNSLFNSHISPSIQLSRFIKRIHHYTQFSPQCLILAIIYLDRYNLVNQQFSLNWLNVHKAYVTCLLLATKYHDDFFYDNKAFELAAGVTTIDLLKFQIQLSTKIQFTFYVSQQEFKTLVDRLDQVYSCNNLSYTDDLYLS